jgi:hypothetical protein
VGVLVGLFFVLLGVMFLTYLAGQVKRGTFEMIGP